MATQQITYADKVEDNGATAAGRFGANDLNEIKNVVNNNAIQGIPDGSVTFAKLTDVNDDNTMAGASDTTLATDESIKAYVDARIDALPLQIYHVREEQTSGTNGGTSLSGVNVRVLNTEAYAGITGASLSSNQITLPAGTYQVTASAPTYKASNNRIYIYNTSDSSDAVLSGTTRSPASGDAGIVTTLNGVFTIAGIKTLELRHYMENASASIGLGTAASSGQVEIYAEAMFTKLA